jgi:hypothetical protein
MLHGDTTVPVGNYRPIQSGHSLGVRVPSETATMHKLEDCWKVEIAGDLSRDLIAGYVLVAEDDERLLDYLRAVLPSPAPRARPAPASGLPLRRRNCPLQSVAGYLPVSLR